MIPAATTWMERQFLDGTTVFSDDLGLPGPPRILGWAVVDDAGSHMCLHMLFDSRDVEEVFAAAMVRAGQLMTLTHGTIAVTFDDIANAGVRPYGEIESDTDVEVPVEALEVERV